jgi:hypothetical protein
VAHGNGLEDTSDDGDETGDLESGFTAVLVSEPRGNETSDETSCLEGGSNVGV